MRSLAADGPKLHVELGEVAGNVEGERVADRQHLPSRALPVELEVAVTGVIGQLARRHRQRQQRNAGQLQADELADLVAGGHLGLLQQLFAQLLLGHAGTHCQYEIGALHQLALVHHGHHYAVLVLAQLDGDGARWQHCAQRLAQGQHYRLEAHLLIVVPIGRELRRQAGLVGEGHQLATKLHQGLVQALRMQGAKARQMRKLGLGPVQQLQHHELGHIGHPLLAGRCDALGKAARPLRHQTRRLAEEAFEGRNGRHADAAGHEVGIQDQTAIGAFVQNAGDGQGGVGTAIFALQHQTQADPTHFEGDYVSPFAVKIAHVMAMGLQTGGDLAAQPHLVDAAHRERQRQIDLLVGHRGIGDFQRRRQHIVVGDVKHGTVRQYAGGPHQGDAAKAEVILVDGERLQPVEIVGQRAQPGMQRVIRMSLLLLEVLGLDEEPLTPDNPISTRHNYSSSFFSSTSSRRRCTRIW